MASSLLLVLLLTLTITATATVYTYKEKPFCLKFYLHDTTIVEVVPPVNNNSTFGQITVVDNELRKGPKASSELIGRLQGFAVGSSMEDSYAYTAFFFVFIEGPYSGSSLACNGRVGGPGPTRVVSINGGTGVFKLARGYAVLRAVPTLSGLGINTFEVNVFLYEY